MRLSLSTSSFASQAQFGMARFHKPGEVLAQGEKPIVISEPGAKANDTTILHNVALNPREVKLQEQTEAQIAQVRAIIRRDGDKAVVPRKQGTPIPAKDALAQLERVEGRLLDTFLASAKKAKTETEA